MPTVDPGGALVLAADDPSLKFSAPEAFFKPDAAECAALGVAACRRNDCGAPGYFCYDTAAQSVAWFLPYEATGHGETVPCTRGQFEHWLAVEQDDCVKPASIQALPSALLLLLADGVAASSTICTNVSSTRFRLKGPAGTLRLIHLPDSCGSIQSETQWAACAEPAAGKVWRTDLPFLQCSSYANCGWKSPAGRCLRVASDCARKCVSLGDKIWGSADWPSILVKFASEFEGCPPGDSMP